MLTTIKKLVEQVAATAGLSYKIARGIDYRTLSLYILKINQQKDIDSILLEVSRCLKEILDYELFGFVLKNEQATDVWIDPRVFAEGFTDHVANDLGGQKIDFSMHYFETIEPENSHNTDALDINNLISYKVMDNKYESRLYIKPRRTMMAHHDNIISTIISSISIALEKNLNIKQLEHAAAFDPLTGCYNRRALSSFIEREIAYARRNKKELSVIMLDMDNFKEINDVHGHLAGDTVLKEVAELFRAVVRKSDYLARYGGEEFMLVLPDTPLYNAVQLADKLRKTIEAHAIQINGKTIRTTASFGVASLESKLDHSSLFQEADERMYQAKSIGKNTVVPSMLPCFADRHFITKELENSYPNIAQVA